MILIINTSNPDQALVALYHDKRIIKEKIRVEFNESEKLLPLIDKLLSKKKVSPRHLKAIFVVQGPGPFTSLRVGISVANSLAWALGIPILGFRTSEFKNLNELALKGFKKLKNKKAKPFLTPYYAKAPNITKPKKKW